jgi:hypothetical protein
MTDTQKLLLTTGITIELAFIGYLVTYVNSLRLSQRAEQLARVNRQLAEYYGPLFALTQAGDSAWAAFGGEKFRPGSEAFFEGREIAEGDLRAWRTWMKTVFMPTNRRIYECILTKSDLLIEPKMPQCLLDLCAHVASYEPVLAAWDAGDYSEHTGLLNFPDDIVEYAQASFEKLKAEQQKLMHGSSQKKPKRAGKSLQGQS